MSDKPSALNTRPGGEEFAERTDALAEECAERLGALVVLVAAQDMGKMAISTGGRDRPGEELDEFRRIIGGKDESPARFLRLTAKLCDLAEREKRGEDVRDELSGPPPEVVEQMRPFIEVIARLLRIHEKRGDDESRTLALHMLAAAAHDAMQSEELPDDGRPLQVEFAPGAFDNFEGTQEELQALIAEARQAFADGSYKDKSRKLTPDEAQELREQLEREQQKNTRQ